MYCYSTKSLMNEIGVYNYSSSNWRELIDNSNKVHVSIYKDNNTQKIQVYLWKCRVKSEH